MERLHLPSASFIKTEHCALFLSKKEIPGDAGFSVVRERWSAIFDTDVTKVLYSEFAGKMVVDVGYCTPTPVHVCEEFHCDEVDLGDVPWRDWHMDDPGLEGDDETEEIVRKIRRR